MIFNVLKLQFYEIYIYEVDSFIKKLNFNIIIFNKKFLI